MAAERNLVAIVFDAKKNVPKNSFVAVDSLWFWTKIFNERLLEKLWKSRDPLEETIAEIQPDLMMEKIIADQN